MLQKILKILSNIEDFPLTLTSWLLAFSSIIAIRILGETLISDFQNKSVELFAGSALVAYLFFLFSFVMLALFLSQYLKEPLEKAANFLLWGYIIVIFPPLIDKLLCGSQKCWSFYAFDSINGLIKRYFTFFGDNPYVGITFGVRIEVAIAVIFISLYIWLKSGKILKSLLGGLITYSILFILGSFPSWLTFIALFGQKNIMAIQGYDVAGLFLSPARYFSVESKDILNSLNAKMNLIYGFLAVPLLILFFYLNFKKKFWSVIYNVRWVQIMIHVGLVLFGASLGAFYFPTNLTTNIFSFFALSNLILSAVFAWLASVFLNDQEDIEIDKLTNASRPTVTGKVSLGDYQQLFWSSFALSLLLALTVGAKFLFLILIYQIIGWIYSARPFRLKRIPGIASFLSALNLALLFISGLILLADGQDFSKLPPGVIWLLLFAFTISLPVKDLKDIEGDKKNSVFTIPVLLGEVWARFLIGLGIFISYSLSVVWLNAKIMFLPAMFLGALSFWILQNKKISPRRVHIWVFGLLFVYVLLMVYFLIWPIFVTAVGE